MLKDIQQHLYLIEKIYNQPYFIEYIEDKNYRLKIFLEVLKYAFYEKQKSLNFSNYENYKYYQDKNNFIFRYKNFKDIFIKRIANNEYLANMPFSVFQRIFNAISKDFDSLLSSENENFILFDIPLLYFHLDPSFLLKAIEIIKEKVKWRNPKPTSKEYNEKINELLIKIKIFLEGLIYYVDDTPPLFNSFEEMENKLERKDIINLLKICFNLNNYTKDFLKPPIQTQNFLLLAHEQFKNNPENVKNSWKKNNKSLKESYTIEKIENLKKYLKSLENK